MRKRATSLRVTLARSKGFPSTKRITLLALPTANDSGGAPENSRVPGCAFSEKITSPLLRTSVHDLPLKVNDTRRSPSKGAVGADTGASGLLTGGEITPVAVGAGDSIAPPVAAAGAASVAGDWVAGAGAPITLPEDPGALVAVAVAASACLAAAACSACAATAVFKVGGGVVPPNFTGNNDAKCAP